MQDLHYTTLPQAGPAMQCLSKSSVSHKSLSSSVVLGINGMHYVDFLSLEVLISSKLKDDPEEHEESVESAEFATEYVLLWQGRNKQTNK